jgi:hypothetical protein
MYLPKSKKMSNFEFDTYQKKPCGSLYRVLHSDSEPDGVEDTIYNAFAKLT